LLCKNHPNKHPNNKKATAKILEANEAYEILSNPIKKKEYDDALLRLLNDEIEIVKLSRKETRQTKSEAKVGMKSGHLFMIW
jgi:DnaJ-class molecular chaperone